MWGFIHVIGRKGIKKEELKKKENIRKTRKAHG
jgi:hypothetical protein